MKRAKPTEHFQGEAFEVTGVAGDVIESLTGFTSHTDDRPGMLLLRLRRAGLHQVFLSAFFGFWDPLDEGELVWVMRTYADARLVDYGEHWGLVGAEVRSVRCARTQPEGTGIVMELDRGVLVLREVDPSDPHSDSMLAWTRRDGR